MIGYMVTCIAEFARLHGISRREAFRFLREYKAIDFLKENYGIEHTLSINDAMEDMLIICRNNGGVLG